MRVVVTADDLGYSSCRDAGILECARSGVVRAVSLLVTGASAASAARSAAAVPTLSLGLHLNLTEGAPASPAASVRSLLDLGSSHMRGKMGFRSALAAGAISLDEVRTEVRSQLAKFASLTGAAPSHADGHQHVHILPGIREIFAEEVAAAGISWVRVPSLGYFESAALPPDRAAFYRGVDADCPAARAIFAAHGLRSSIAFAGFTLGGSACSIAAVLGACTAAMSQKSIDGIADHNATAHAFEAAPDLELMFHPGIPVPLDAPVAEAGCGGASADDFSQSPDRGAELELLTSVDLRSRLESQGIALCRWGSPPTPL